MTEPKVGDVYERGTERRTITKVSPGRYVHADCAGNRQRDAVICFWIQWKKWVSEAHKVEA